MKARTISARNLPRLSNESAAISIFYSAEAKKWIRQ